MIFGPKIGDSVRLHYKASIARIAAFETPVGFGSCQGAVGVVEIIGQGPGPKNLGVRVGAHLVTFYIAPLKRSAAASPLRSKAAFTAK